MTAQRVLLTILGWLWCGCAMAQDVVFGPVEVASTMGEPLHVRIPLQGSPKSPLENLEVLWGVPTNYSHPGGPALTIVVQPSEGGDVLLVDSDRSMTIPFFTLLVKFVMDGQIYIQNFPVFLGDQGNNTIEPGQEGHPPPLQAPAESRVSTALEPQPAMKSWKSLAIGLVIVMLSGVFITILRNKYRNSNKVLNYRGFSRKRPMAVPMATRSTQGVAEYVLREDPGIAAFDSPVVVPESHPGQPTTAVQEKETVPEVSANAVVKGVRILSAARKKTVSHGQQTGMVVADPEKKPLP
ncbi:MAG: hypothetical protein HQL07_08265 [Nitrospirae bacterium]|nr:hypothetical protein [Magnetococcales bacterium]